MDIKHMTLEQKIGQLFVVGFPGEEPSEDFKKLVRERKAGNVILFSHNIKSRRQLKELTQKLDALIREETGIHPLISMDEEGGRVSRLPEPSPVMPAAMAQGLTNDTKMIYKGARITGEELLDMGINLNLAPVLDIHTNPDNPVIGARSFGTDAHTVTQCARAAAKGYMDSGILCSGKHFPGHGDTGEDSHLALPKVNKSLEEMEKCELIPFRELILDGIPAMTVAHMIVPALSGESIPCTMSKTAVTGYLRNKLKFKGLIISDCMEMNAIKEYFGIERGTVAALNAGIDLIFISHTALAAESAIREVRAALDDGRLSEEIIDRAVSHVIWAKEKLRQFRPVKARTEAKERIDFAKRFLEITLDKSLAPAKHRFTLGERPFFVSVRPASVTGIFNETSEQWNFSDTLADQLGGTGAAVDLDPDCETIQRIVRQAETSTSIVAATLNSRLYAGQKALISALARPDRPMLHAELGNPEDLNDDYEAVCRVPLYEYSKRIADYLAGYLKNSLL